MFLRAARHAELDPMTGVSANVMCGQEGYFGTGSFQVMLDMEAMKGLGDKAPATATTLEQALQVESASDPCSVQNVAISGTTAYVKGGDMGDVDDNYDPGF